MEIAAERKAARQYEAAQKKRERDAARAEAAERKARERREKAIEKTKEALRAAHDAHDGRASALEEERTRIERRIQEEEEHWDNEKRSLVATLRQANE